jgi:hypothetical protein
MGDACRPIKWAITVLHIVVTCAFAAACDPLIGDDCETSIDCSEDGDRFCDRTQPGGYCTIVDCEPGSCPGEGVCVQFFDGVHARNYCMRQCDGRGDCRERYQCIPGVSGVTTILDDPFSHAGYCAPRTD